jgi:hypothetical protein
MRAAGSSLARVPLPHSSADGRDGVCSSLSAVALLSLDPNTLLCVRSVPPSPLVAAVQRVGPLVGEPARRSPIMLVPSSVRASVLPCR